MRVITVILAGIVSAALLTGTARAGETLTNQSVIDLHELGLGESVILEAMESATTDFDVDIAGLTNLKRAGISDAVIAAMMRMTRKQEAAVVADTAPPEKRRPPGIYVAVQEPEGQALRKMEPSTFAQTKTSNLFGHAISGGLAKAKVKGLLAGRSANRQLDEAQPSFFFYFDVQNTSLSHSALGAWRGATNPGQFVLVQAKQRKDGRTLAYGEMSAFGASSGTSTREMIPFAHESVANGIYRAWPKAPLDAGEYAFYVGSGATGGTAANVFDFGVRASAVAAEASDGEKADEKPDKPNRAPRKRKGLGR